MKTYSKMVVGFHSEKFNSYGAVDEWLYYAQRKESKVGLQPMPSDTHFFIALNEQRTRSEMGVVKQISKPISAEELAILDYTSRGVPIDKLTQLAITEYETFLEKVNTIPEQTPVGVFLTDKLTNDMKKVEYLKLYTLPLKRWTEERKEALFGWRV
ncbi:hypothetical protein JOC54_000319 [Alkalihalobacillus xiaoxiensis]|uniref:Uncharacterized protein n=1 Tax=Shouchella xiaoxiensis TaxID=766895 RepID=A0ABS2SNJ5_9BACI|nr:hypothetical protein [Shouchella xiaoxiensis]MBM7837088.1 hypothetical protein [Shouchella xiaoxiensis]